MAPLLPSQVRPDVQGRFEALYRSHVRDVYGFSLGLLGNAEDAEDVTQTTFLNAYRALERGEDVRNLRAWLLAIAHNVCRQRFRTAARRPREVELDPEAVEAYVDEDAPTAAEIRSAMRQLSFNQRTVLVLREIEGLSYEEIAQAMDLSLSAVETLLFRARRALREQLEAADKDLGCHAVERLISLQLDGKLSRQDKGLLRAHLRTCAECARFARSQRARKRIMPSLVAVPLPAGLSGAFAGGGGGAGGLGLLTSKAAALAVSVTLIGTGALVESGVVSKPGRDAGATAGPVDAWAPPSRDAPAWVPAASLERALAGSKPRAASARASKPAREAKPGAEGGKRGGKRSAPKQDNGGRGSPETGQVAAGSGGGAGGGSAAGSTGGGAGSSGGGVGSLTGSVGVQPPKASALPVVPDVPVVGDAVKEVEDKVLPPAGSKGNATPSLPSVSVDGTVTLP